MSEDHETLVEDARSGDEPALQALLMRHLPGLRAYVRLHTGPRIRREESCSDLVQSVCVDVLRDLDRFEYRGEAAFRRWLYTKALGKIVNRDEYYGAQKRGRELRAEAPDQACNVPEPCAPFCTPSQVAIAREELERLERAFDELSDEQRQVITLARLLGLPHAEIAQEMGRSVGSVRVLLHRAVVRLGWLMMRSDGLRGAGIG